MSPSMRATVDVSGSYFCITEWNSAYGHIQPVNFNLNMIPQNPTGDSFPEVGT